MEMKDLEAKGGESSGMMLERIERARQMQQERFRNSNITFNAQMGPGEIGKYCSLERKEKKFVEQEEEKARVPRSCGGGKRLR